jgi:hypothetical protein
MDFIHFLSSHMLDPTVGGKRLYKTSWSRLAKVTARWFTDAFGAARARCDRLA